MKRAERSEQDGVYGPEVFDLPPYAGITRARLEHLASLALPLERRSVVDLGCGIGRLSEFFLQRQCKVLAVDAREENLEELRRNYPGVGTKRLDLESDLSALGSFDIVFCYGLLYHLADPLQFLRRAAGLCHDLLLLETCVTDAQAPLVQLVPEETRNPSQSIIGVGSRPSPAYVSAALRLAGFEHVYEPVKPPEHPDYQYVPLNDASHERDGRLLRRIMIAARKPCTVTTLRRCQVPL